MLGAAIGLAAIFLFGGLPQSQAQTAAELPPQARELIKLLEDPALKTWLVSQGKAAAAPQAAAADDNPVRYLGEEIRQFGRSLGALFAYAPKLPGDLAGAFARIWAELAGFGLLGAIALFLAFGAMGVGAIRLLNLATAKARIEISEREIKTVSDRLQVVLTRLAFSFGVMACGIAGSIGAFLLFDWPPLLRETVLTALAALVIFAVTGSMSMFLLAPSAAKAFKGIQRFRVVPMDDAAADFWHKTIRRLAAWISFTFFIMLTLRSYQLGPEGVRSLGSVLGLGHVFIVVRAAWTRPRAPLLRSVAAGPAQGAGSAFTFFTAALMAAVWLSRAAGAYQLMVFILAGWGLWIALRAIGPSVRHILRPVEGAAEPEQQDYRLLAVILDRGLSLAALVLAAWAVLRSAGLGMNDMQMQGRFAGRILAGVFQAALIITVADFIWRVVKVMMDRWISKADGHALTDGDEMKRQQRARTLLPTIRNILLVVFVIVAGMMSLSALGVDIGPLIASAGIVGVAVGFGAQTLVRDVLSGMFYLFDDAFRMGEYIQTDRYKGTVESFSLRSVKLRHHRGALTTIPFGSLGAVQNMSRDWVIDKILIGVGYDTDLEKARKLIKKIGLAMMEDEELKPYILEPLKMQGVEKFGDYAIDIRLKVMTVPSEQSTVRRKVLYEVKKVFDANGIKFALPTVHISGAGNGADGAAAQHLRDAKAKAEIAGAAAA